MKSAIDIICNDSKINIPIKRKKLYVCEYCLFPFKKLMKCKCGIMICPNCATFINNLPFCNECVIDIVKNKSLLIITKGLDK